MKGSFKEYINKQGKFESILNDSSNFHYLGDHLYTQSSFLDVPEGYNKIEGAENSFYSIGEDEYLDTLVGAVLPSTMGSALNLLSKCAENSTVFARLDQSTFSVDFIRAAKTKRHHVICSISDSYGMKEYVKTLNVPVICFPREIKNYKEFCEVVKPDAVNIDYNVDPSIISKNIKIPVQGGLDPKILLTDKENLKKETLKYLDIFKDHPYIFNLGHGILPETNPDMVEFLIKTVKDY